MKLNFLLSAAAILLASSTFAATYTSTTVEQRNITYKGGPVLTGQINVYFVFYGNWSKEESESTYTNLMDFTDNISESEWFNTLQYYTDSNGKGVTGPLKTAAAVIDNFSQHQYLTQNSSDSSNIPEFQLDGNDAHIKIIEDATSNTAHLGDAIDSHGIYVVFTSEEVSMDGFCQDWCGYNAWTDKFTYAVIGHPSRCPDSCVPPLNKNNSPNGNIYADAMVNTFAHELIDMLTDPTGSGYRVSESETEEVADFCMPPTASSDEWWGTELKQTGSGANYNVALGANGVYKYLIQSIWSPKESKCVIGSSNV